MAVPPPHVQLRRREIGTEHLLLGLASVREGTAADLLRQRGVSDVDELRSQIVRRINDGAPYRASTRERYQRR